MARVQSTTTEAFDELRIALNPLLGDLYPVFRFEQFRDCPIDIRFLIYEAYFRAESSRPQLKSVSMNRTVRNSSSPPVWPRIDVTRPTPWILEDNRQAFRQGSGNMPFQDSQYFSQRPVGSEVVCEHCRALSGKVS
jgi:hypothetical protein